MRLAALWYGADRPTVNEAETTALHDLMVYLGSLDCWEGV